MSSRKRPRARSSALNRARREGYAAGVNNWAPRVDTMTSPTPVLRQAWWRAYDRGQVAVKAKVAIVLEGVFARARGEA